MKYHFHFKLHNVCIIHWITTSSYCPKTIMKISLEKLLFKLPSSQEIRNLFWWVRKSRVSFKRNEKCPLKNLYMNVHSSIFIYQKGGNNPNVHQPMNGQIKCGTSMHWNYWYMRQHGMNLDIMLSELS